MTVPRFASGPDKREHRRYHTAIKRLLTITEMLRHGPVWQAKLVAEFGVTARTIRRDMATIGEVLPVYDEWEDGKKVWRLVR